MDCSVLADHRTCVELLNTYTSSARPCAITTRENQQRTGCPRQGLPPPSDVWGLARADQSQAELPATAPGRATSRPTNIVCGVEFSTALSANQGRLSVGIFATVRDPMSRLSTPRGRPQYDINTASSRASCRKTGDIGPTEETSETLLSWLGCVVRANVVSYMQI
ncbi:hypothetical protein J6590_038578 [Homalodisca vitripennis]|nr:hypothetical protein J6590_038578 [Homalodisca vitripennis]